MSSSDGGKRASKGLGENGDGVTGLGWARLGSSMVGRPKESIYEICWTTTTRVDSACDAYRVKDEAQEMVMVLEEKWWVVGGTWVG